METQLLWLALHRITWTKPQQAWELIKICGSIQKLLCASRHALCSVADEQWSAIEQLRQRIDWRQARRDLDYLTFHNIRLVIRGHTDYPLLLDEITDPPLLLFWKGTHQPNQAPNCISVVGTRKPTSQGVKLTSQIVSDLVEAGYTIISGLAFGIDGSAHRAALNAGGVTIAVLASGIDTITPRAHQKLGEQIMERGALCSEVPIGTPAHASHFLWRNRIISGLSRSVLIVESTIKSGTMVTAGHAADQGRNVFAVPGPIDSQLSEGPNLLISDGAYVCRSIEDIANPKVQQNPEDKKYGHPKALDDTTTHLLEILTTGPRSSNQLAEALQVPITQVLQRVTMLECEGVIQVLPNGLIAQL